MHTRYCVIFLLSDKSMNYLHEYQSKTNKAIILAIIADIVICSCHKLRNEFNFWNVHGIMNTWGLLHSNKGPKGFTLILLETRSIHDSMNIPKIEFIAYIYRIINS